MAAAAAVAAEGVEDAVGWSPPSLGRVPSFVRIVEVAPRDGLQALQTDAEITVDTKISLIQQLAHAGLRSIEAGSFVSAEWVPLMKGSDEVLRAVLADPDMTDVAFPVLVPNTYGFKQALEAGAHEIAPASLIAFK